MFNNNTQQKENTFWPLYVLKFIDILRVCTQTQECSLGEHHTFTLKFLWNPDKCMWDSVCYIARYVAAKHVNIRILKFIWGFRIKLCWFVYKWDKIRSSFLLIICSHCQKHKPKTQGVWDLGNVSNSKITDINLELWHRSVTLASTHNPLS